MSRELGKPVSMDTFKGTIIRTFGEVFGLSFLPLTHDLLLAKATSET